MAKPVQAGFIGKLFVFVLVLIILAVGVAVASLFFPIPWVTENIINLLKQAPQLAGLFAA